MIELMGTVVPTAVLTAVLTGGITWGTIKATVNGLVPRVASIEAKLDVVGEDVAYLKGRHALDDAGHKV